MGGWVRFSPIKALWGGALLLLLLLLLKTPVGHIESHAL
jgi:hypothetical protein